MLPGIGMTEMVVLGIIAVLLFGERLPEMARKVGAYYTDFRKGLSNIQSEMNSITREVNSVGSSTSYTSRKTTTTTTSGPSADDYDEATAPKFEPPPAPPTPSGEWGRPGEGDADRSCGAWSASSLSRKGGDKPKNGKNNRPTVLVNR